jgi:hypothetical protein
MADAHYSSTVSTVNDMIRRYENQLRSEFQLRMEIELERQLNLAREQLQAQQMVNQQRQVQQLLLMEREMSLRSELALEMTRALQVEKERMKRNLTMQMDGGVMRGGGSHGGMDFGVFSNPLGMERSYGMRGSLVGHAFGTEERQVGLYDHPPPLSTDPALTDRDVDMGDGRTGRRIDYSLMGAHGDYGLSRMEPEPMGRYGMEFGGVRAESRMRQARDELVPDEAARAPVASQAPVWDDAIGENGQGRRHARDYNPESLVLRRLFITVRRKYFR